MLLDVFKIDPALKARALAAKPRLHAQMIHLILTFLAGAAISTLLHQPMVMLTFLAVGWMTSIFLFGIGPLPYWRIVLSVASQALILYLIYRFAPWPLFG